MKLQEGQNVIEELFIKYYEAIQKIQKGIWLFGAGKIGQKKETSFREVFF